MWAKWPVRTRRLHQKFPAGIFHQHPVAVASWLQGLKKNAAKTPHKQQNQQTTIFITHISASIHYLTVVDQILSIKMCVPFIFSAWSPQIPAYHTLNDVQPEATGGSRGATLTVEYMYKCHIYNLWIYIYLYIPQSCIQTYLVRYAMIRCMCMTPYHKAHHWRTESYLHLHPTNNHMQESLIVMKLHQIKDIFKKTPGGIGGQEAFETSNIWFSDVVYVWHTSNI